MWNMWTCGICGHVLVAALMALKRKKRYEKQLQQIDGTLSTIEFQREALQNASTNTEVLRVMGDAAKALKTAHKNMYDQRFLYNLFDCLFCLSFSSCLVRV